VGEDWLRDMRGIWRDAFYDSPCRWQKRKGCYYLFLRSEEIHEGARGEAMTHTREDFEAAVIRRADREVDESMRIMMARDAERERCAAYIADLAHAKKYREISTEAYQKYAADSCASNERIAAAMERICAALEKSK
jgi:hypothetical protein